MFGSSVVEIAIGIIFVYLLLSLICSAVNEIIESLLKNRATDLERGIRQIFTEPTGGGLVEEFYKHPLIDGLFPGPYKRKSGKAIGLFDFLKPTNLPSYIPARNFANAVLDLILYPPADGSSGKGNKPLNSPALTVAPMTMKALYTAIEDHYGNTQVGRSLRTLAQQSGNNLDEMRENIESWFNGSMDRVSGAYKRRTQWILFGLGLILTVLLNVNTVTIIKKLSTDVTLRSVIVAEAESAAKNPATLNPDLKANREELNKLGLPIGWPNGFFNPVASGETFKWWDHVWLSLLGWLLTAGAISLGAPFWFDLLNKFMVIRSTVKPHEKSLEEGSEDRQPQQPSNTKPETSENSAPGVNSSDTPPQDVTGTTAVTELTAVPEPEFASEEDPPNIESHLDGCEVAIEQETLDEDLPPSEGGIE